MTNQKHKNANKMPLKSYGYARVSTKDQAIEGVSIEAQQTKIKYFAKIMDLDLIETITDDGHSGKDLKRPGIQRLLELVKNNKVDAIIVYKLDRLSRKTRELLLLIEETFEKGEVKLFSISEQIDTRTPMGKFFLTMMAGLAQMEREVIAERTRLSMAHKKEKGEYLGHIPYGFELDQNERLVKNPFEQNIVRRMKRWRKEGMSYRRIADLLNEKGFPTRKEGAKWYASSVRYVLLR